MGSRGDRDGDGEEFEGYWMEGSNIDLAAPLFGGGLLSLFFLLPVCLVCG